MQKSDRSRCFIIYQAVLLKSQTEPMFHHISSCVTQKSDRSRCFIIYQAVLLKFYRCCSYARVRIGVHMTIVDPSSVRVLWLKAYQEARDFVLLFQGIQVQIPKQSFMIYIWKWRFADKAKKHKKEKDTEQTSQSKVSKIIIALTTFFYSLIIHFLSYHI